MLLLSNLYVTYLKWFNNNTTLGNQFSAIRTWPSSERQQYLLVFTTFDSTNYISRHHRHISCPKIIEAFQIRVPNFGECQNADAMFVTLQAVIDSSPCSRFDDRHPCCSCFWHTRQCTPPRAPPMATVMLRTTIHKEYPHSNSRIRVSNTKNIPSRSVLTIHYN
jgi:hypothetical protein